MAVFALILPIQCRVQLERGVPPLAGTDLLVGFRAALSPELTKPVAEFGNAKRRASA